MEPELDCDAEAARLESEELENEVGIDEMGLEVADGGGRLDSTARVTGGDALPRVADGCGRVAPDARSSVPCYTYKGGSSITIDHDRSRSIRTGGLGRLQMVPLREPGRALPHVGLDSRAALSARSVDRSTHHHHPHRQHSTRFEPIWGF